MFDIAEKSVFVAETSMTMRSYKQNITKELEHLGCNVISPSNPIQNIDEYSEFIGQCDIAIHIFSNKDEILDSEGTGIEENQINYSISHYSNKELSSKSSELQFNIIAWHPKSKNRNIYDEENISAHILRIQKLDEIELLRTTFEEFKSHLFKKNDSKSSGLEEIKSFEKNKNNLSVYFIYDLKDNDIAKEVTKEIEKKGFVIYSPLFTTDVIKVRQQHNFCLKNCDIAIIFSSNPNINWVNMKLMDVLKSPGLGRENPILGNAVVIPLEMRNKIPLLNRGFEFIAFENNTLTYPIEQFLKKVLKK